ncbi:sodium:neurotransmitter symporter [Salinisphaera sp. C84B14]|uniref:sodium-dependent transporter n=1 Tax=Salinisphaera sp. C84B14 TaxID=1304155 RepID=UPI0033418239
MRLPIQAPQALMVAFAQRPEWSSSSRFVIAMTAAVVSLSNLWRLPYLLSDYGAGAFLLVYVTALLSMGLPLLSGQLLMARGTRADVPGVIAAWTRNAPHSRLWIWSGYLAVVGAGMLLAAYSVVAAWSLAYSLRGVTGMLDGSSVSAASAQFVTFARDSERGFGWLLLFFGLIVATAAHGLRRGVEPVMRTLAFCMLMALTALVVSAAMHARADDALYAIFAVDFAALGWRGVFEALYQAFFTLSLGTGVVVCFGSYLPSNTPVVRFSLIILGVDLAVSLACAFMLAVFVGPSEADLDVGIQSLFETLPVAMAGDWQAPIMFVLVALVSLSTAIGLFEPVVQLVQQRSGYTRLRATLYSGLVLALLGMAALLSFGVLDRVTLCGYNLFGWLMLITAQLIGPLTGLLLCILLGRVLARKRLVDAWQHAGGYSRATGFAVWHALLRYPTRIVLVLVLAYALGALRLIEMVWFP